MGGRGSSGGVSSLRLPKPQTVEEFPKLQGTQKQVAWANDIRDQVYNKLLSGMHQTKEGYPTQAVDYVFSRKDMGAWVRVTKDTFGGPYTPKHITDQHVNRAIESLHTAVKQVEALKNLIRTETSAKFWIDHRNTHPADPTWKKLKKSILGY